MSEVLAIKVGEKRPFEDETEKETVSCSGHRMALLELSDNQRLLSPPAVQNWLDRVSWKKSRRFWTRETTNTKATDEKINVFSREIELGTVSACQFRESSVRSESDSDDSVGSDKSLKPLTKRLASRTRVMKCSSCGSHNLFPVDCEEDGSGVVLQESTESDISAYIPLKFWKMLNSKGENRDFENEKLFSLKELKEIVSEALANKTRHLAHRYNAVIQEKLAEQFQSFSKFNEDYVSRQLKERECSYLS
ncbi:hypothetical protein Gasu2_51900 [Galdieria sulphuraria]|uniref:Uncharacterized protein n=1 Tax=Galdieria sulphuraria TaxID=130081 RepID=M2XU72_GALSU|nr:uncharacterized protein Gasu_54080 [Galdieria sulphuraria]EME26954.1 hypothetical protein Gasu_54080 [Galdieria sulphuraria]GJD11033.1 hypothetical protein Gasu2_51900 [Galdieria sulphuraria]|eukprot:XP_005703474.1 hypothetical protein Gasu_54080 [Galdieria sulphuraria]